MDRQRVATPVVRVSRESHIEVDRVHAGLQAPEGGVGPIRGGIAVDGVRPLGHDGRDMGQAGCV